MATNLIQIEIIKDLLVIESDLGNPTFVWQGNTYNFIPSITEFKKELDTGGYVLTKLLTATVRRLDANYNTIFTTGLPNTKTKIVYSTDGETYRIDSIKQDATGAYFRMTATTETKGI